MKSLSYYFIISTLSTLLASTLGCQKSSDSQPSMPDIELSDVTSSGCLSAEKLSNLLQRPNYSYPAAMMTTDFKVLGSSSATKTSYLTYSAFFYKLMPINQMGILPLATQINCEKILLHTSSNEILTYQITNSSENRLQFHLTDEYADTVPDYKRKALSERPLVTEYTIDLLPGNSLKVVLKSRTLDPICNSKNLVTTETTKYIFWARSSEELPAKYEISPDFLNSVKSLTTSIPAPVPNPEIPLLQSEFTSVAEILDLSSQPLREEWKTCR